jgi:hypothetical protein
MLNRQPYPTDTSEEKWAFVALEDVVGELEFDKRE